MDPVIRPDFPAAFVVRWKMRSHKNHMGGSGLSLWSQLCACGSALGLSGSGSCGSGLAGSGDMDHVRVIQPVAGPGRPYAPRGLEPTTDMVFVGTQNSVPQWGAESSFAGQWLLAAGGDGAWTVRTGSGPMRMCGDIFAAARLWRGRFLTTGHLSSSCPVVVGAGDVAWGSRRRGGRKRGRAPDAHCHLRAGFQQCKSFVEMCTVRCCPLWHPANCSMGTVPRVMVRRTV
jgi:hypothetical protein